MEIYHGIILEQRGTRKEFKYFPDLWEYYGWDIYNNKEHKQMADAIVRELFCYGSLTCTDKGGREIYLELIP